MFNKIFSEKASNRFFNFIRILPFIIIIIIFLLLRGDNSVDPLVAGFAIAYYGFIALMISLFLYLFFGILRSKMFKSILENEKYKKINKLKVIIYLLILLVFIMFFIII